MIILISVLLLLAYIFDITSSRTKVPSVILLLVLGWGVSYLVDFFKIPVPDLSPILPMLGTIGLILIVLEGSLELELNKSKLSIIRQTSLLALVPMLLLSFALGYAFQFFGDTTFKIGFANAIPFAIISSAIAIPSAQNLSPKNKEFITYESSLSDIYGVILFNFITSKDNIQTDSVTDFGLNLFVILLITIVSTLGLALLLSKIKHHVKFVPIILMILLIYDISKIYHLPALIFILLFGIFLGNLDEIKHIKYIEKLQPEILDKEVHKFKELTTEFAFLVRALFFLLFGFLIKTSELLNSGTILWAIGITFGIFMIRMIFLRVFDLKPKPLLYIAPRGLITILLFMSIPVSQKIVVANKPLIIQVIILTALVMMFGMITHKTEKTKKEDVKDHANSDENSLISSDTSPSPSDDVILSE